jgi:hypothetical protein
MTINIFSIPVLLMAFFGSCKQTTSTLPYTSEQTNENPTYDSTASFHLQEIKGYRELSDYILGAQYQKQFNQFLDTLKNYNGDETMYTTLNVVLDYIEVNKIPFLIRKGQDNGGFRSSSEAKEFALENFGMVIDISKADDMFEWNDPNLSTANDSLLRLTGLQYGYVNTQSDENIILIHKIKDRDVIKKLVNKIGYPYFEATD